MPEESTDNTTGLLASFAVYNLPLAFILTLLTNIVVSLITSARLDSNSKARTKSAGGPPPFSHVLGLCS